MQTPLDLTFGIELECVMFFDPAEYRGALPHGSGIFWEKRLSSQLHEESKLRLIFREYITKLLTENGFPAYSVASDGGNQKWTVTNDTSIEIKDGPCTGDGFLQCDVEIKSPAMRFCPKALRQVRKVVRLIKRNFDTSMNTSCGFHVHIGNRKKGFPLQTLKHLCMLTAMFEHQLNSLHPAHRIGNLQAKGPSTVFRCQNPWDTLIKIQGCKTKDELVLLYANDDGRLDRCFAYNLCSMVTGPNKTIEFRQHEGTLDLPKIMNWIEVAAGMVDAMHETSTEDLAQLISTCAFEPNYTISDLLIRLKPGDLYAFYYTQLHEHQRPKSLWIRDTIRENAEAAPRQRPAFDRLDQLERRHRQERAKELERIQKLDRRQKLERFRELRIQEESLVGLQRANYE